MLRPASDNRNMRGVFGFLASSKNCTSKSCVDKQKTRVFECVKTTHILIPDISLQNFIYSSFIPLLQHHRKHKATLQTAQDKWSQEENLFLDRKNGGQIMMSEHINKNER